MEAEDGGLPQRSIAASRTIAAENAFTAADCDGSGTRLIGMDTADWTPEQKGELQQPDWDAHSFRSSVSSRSNEQLPMTSSNGHLGVPQLSRPGVRSSRSSFQTDVSEYEYTPDHLRSPYGQVQAGETMVISLVE